MCSLRKKTIFFFSNEKNVFLRKKILILRKKKILFLRERRIFLLHKKEEASSKQYFHEFQLLFAVVPSNICTHFKYYLQ